MSIVDKIISTAKSQIGICEPDGDDKYIKVYNELTVAKFGMDVAWCAIFVTWVMYMCGVAKDVVTRFASCTAGMKWFIKQGKWKNAKAYGGTYTPVPGILIFFSKGHKLTDPSHVGIVTKVTSTYVYTVEGNTSDAVHERKYLLNDPYIIGYGVPAYVNDTKESPKNTDTSTEYQTVEVKKGDTLWEIAEKYLESGSRYREIMSLNSLTSVTIHPGLVLSIPGTNASANEAAKKTKTYTVKKGDTLWGIAEKYLKNGSRYVEIMSLSKITGTTIRIGQVLTLPAA
jgi:LysM repeat protein